MHTSKDYCDNIRELGAKMASGELQEYRLSLTALFEIMEPDDYHKVTKSISYTRTIINRVPEVKAVGSIQIRTEDNGDEKFYVFTLKTGSKKRIITEDDLPHLHNVEVNKALRKLIKNPPRITDLEGEALKGAAIAIERYIETINDAMRGKEQ